MDVHFISFGTNDIIQKTFSIILFAKKYIFNEIENENFFKQVIYVEDRFSN